MLRKMSALLVVLLILFVSNVTYAGSDLTREKAEYLYTKYFGVKLTDPDEIAYANEYCQKYDTYLAKLRQIQLQKSALLQQVLEKWRINELYTKSEQREEKINDEFKELLQNAEQKFQEEETVAWNNFVDSFNDLNKKYPEAYKSLITRIIIHTSASTSDPNSASNPDGNEAFGKTWEKIREAYGCF